MRRIAVTVGVVAGFVALGGPAARAEPAGDPARLVEQRQQEIRRMSEAMRVIGRFLKAEGATVADVGASAQVIRVAAAELIDGLFPEGTAIGVGRSGARPEIWQQWDIFKEQAKDLGAAASRLAAAAATGDPEAVRAPIGAVSRACGACHELFRRKAP